MVCPVWTGTGTGPKTCHGWKGSQLGPGPLSFSFWILCPGYLLHTDTVRHRCIQMAHTWYLWPTPFLWIPDRYSLLSCLYLFSRKILEESFKSKKTYCELSLIQLGLTRNSTFSLNPLIPTLPHIQFITKFCWYYFLNFWNLAICLYIFPPKSSNYNKPLPVWLQNSVLSLKSVGLAIRIET